MGIFQLDLTIRTMIELGIDDMRKNPWLLDHMLEDCINNSYLKDKYGQKQVDSCKEWFKNNQIDIYMRPRNDKDNYPCITITPGNASEKEGMKSMADLSTETKVLLPNEIGKPIPYVVKPFVPTNYDDSTGELGIDPSTPGITGIATGMILVDPSTGNGYVIKDIGTNSVFIEAGIEIKASKLGIVPQFQYYVARIEHSFFQESCEIGCYAHGDPQVTLWLHSIVEYSLLRYRESLLEFNGFAESIINNGPLSEDPNFTGPGGESVFVRSINLSGQTENTWIKTPRRFIENVAIKENTAAGTGSSFLGGIKILSNLDSPSFIDKTKELWYTDAENEIDPNDPEDQEES